MKFRYGETEEPRRKDPLGLDSWHRRHSRYKRSAEEDEGYGEHDQLRSTTIAAPPTNVFHGFVFRRRRRRITGLEAFAPLDFGSKWYFLFSNLAFGDLGFRQMPFSVGVHKVFDESPECKEVSNFHS